MSCPRVANDVPCVKVPSRIIARFETSQFSELLHASIGERIGPLKVAELTEFARRIGQKARVA